MAPNAACSRLCKMIRPRCTMTVPSYMRAVAETMKPAHLIESSWSIRDTPLSQSSSLSMTRVVMPSTSPQESCLPLRIRQLRIGLGTPCSTALLRTLDNSSSSKCSIMKEGAHSTRIIACGRGRKTYRVTRNTWKAENKKRVKHR